MALKVGELFALLELQDGQFHKGLGSAQSAFGGLAKYGAVALAGVATAVAGAGVAVAKMGVDFNANMEQARISFTTLLGSADEAKKMIGDLQQFAAKTPFEFPGLQDSAKLMLAMGFNAKDVLPNLNAVGDAVAAVGGGEDALKGVTMALGQMLTKGKISAEEMNQLAERGIPAWELLAQSTGKSKQELMELGSQGKLLSENVLPGMIDAMGNKFKGAMDNQSKSFTGMMSTIKDNLNMLMGSLTEGLFNQLKGFLPKVIDFTNKFSDAFKKGGVKEAFAAMVPPEVAQKMLLMVNEMKSKLTPILLGLVDIFKKVFELIKLYWDKFGPYIIKNWSIVWDTITTVLKSVIGIINGILDVFIGLFTLDWNRMGKGITAIWTNLWSGIGAIVKGALKLILNALAAIWDGVSSWFVKLAKQAANWAGDFVMGFANGIKDKISSVVSAAKEMASAAADAVTDFLDINSPSGLTKLFGGHTGEGFAIGIEGSQSRIQKAVMSMAGVVMNGFNQLKPEVGFGSQFGGYQQETAMVGGINLTFTGPIHVRDQFDIVQISQEFGNLVQSANRSKGRR